MAASDHTRRQARADDHRTNAEETALLLSLVIVVILGLTLATLVIAEFMAALPGGIGIVLFVSLVVATLAVGQALFERLLSTPTLIRGLTPVVRFFRR